ncbi:hypothetical protein PEPS_10470 [Persicobacter psychrovividus]|uniref:Uncharacterized protein n=2 Tax=Persicobacter psychrovividus TaxID=387638 RepID=A0ABM7VCV1_9BACT|nr:hypothetical protein PEPS_10470 [Persicobacter psychrovividus]
MDEFGTWIYIIGGILWFIYKVLGKKKPQASDQLYEEESGSTAQQEDEFQKLLNEMMGKPAEVKPQNSFEDKDNLFDDEDDFYENKEASIWEEDIDELPVETPPITALPAEDENPYERFQSISDRQIGEETAEEVFVIKKKKPSRPSSPTKKLLRSKGGLKQAVILSEVLNRKY